MNTRSLLLSILAILKIINTVVYIESCNEFVCGSIVTKCMLMQSCTCSINTCSCCPSCLRCLGNFYTECCDCVDMCESEAALGNATQIFHEERLNGSPVLFEALITVPDPEDNWAVVTFPVKMSNIFNEDTTTDEYLLQWYNQEEERIVNDMINCSAVYLDDCTSEAKCKGICESMGAATSLWFQDGCCECAGCPKYSVYESHCASCPADDKESDDVIMDEYDDFGQQDEQILYDEMETGDYGEYD